MQNGSRVAYLSAAFYGLLSLLLVAILFEFLADIVPIGTKALSRNSEAYATAIVLGVWVQFIRPRLHGSRWEWPSTFGAAAVCLAVALIFYGAEDWPTRVTTLNEAFFALAFAIPFFQPAVRRPGPALAVSGVVLAIIVFGAASDLVTDMAETLAILLLVPIALDVVDRGILDPDAPTVRARRYGWYAFLVIAPITLHLLEYQMDIGGWFGDSVRYAVRFYEAFIFLLIFEGFFAVVLGRTGRPDERTRTARIRSQSGHNP